MDKQPTSLLACPFCGHVPARGVDHADPGWPRSDVSVTLCRASEPHAGQYHAEINHWCGLVYVRVSWHDADKERAVQRVVEAWNERAEAIQGRLDL